MSGRAEKERERVRALAERLARRGDFMDAPAAVDHWEEDRPFIPKGQDVVLDIRPIPIPARQRGKVLN